MSANKVALISCAKAKRSYPCAARQLYDASNLFRKSLVYAERIADDIYVLSAKHGLIGLDEVIAPYDETLNDKSSTEKTAWGQGVAVQLSELHDVAYTEFVVLAGKDYYTPLKPHLKNLTLPLLGLSTGFRLAKLDRLIKTDSIGQISECYRLHRLLNDMPRYKWNDIDSIVFGSGIYIVFEKGETYCDMDRIVRVGTHRSDGRLCGRLKDHFLHENKDGSIFRKNIGRAILNKNKHPYLSVWNTDTRKPGTLARLGGSFDPIFQQKLEQQISEYMREHFSFVCFPVPTEAERLRLEEGIIATLSMTVDFTASPNWRGRYSPEYEIAQSGMWLKEGLSGIPLSDDEYLRIEAYCNNSERETSVLESEVPLSSNAVKADQTKQGARTSDVVHFIEGKLIDAKADGNISIIIKSGMIHKEMGLVSRMPTVCGAMRKLIRAGDIVLHSPPKGNGATLEIEYYL